MKYMSNRRFRLAPEPKKPTLRNVVYYSFDYKAPFGGIYNLKKKNPQKLEHHLCKLIIG